PLHALTGDSKLRRQKHWVRCGQTKTWQNGDVNSVGVGWGKYSGEFYM
uniref:Uncharacterized protein n=1 Tax=Meleagris gallopavo TaxID=9103 RepID=A0A803YEF1_MELGA